MRYLMKWVFVASLTTVSAIYAQDKVTLKVDMKPGMEWTFEQTQQMASNNKATFNGASQPFATSGLSKRSGKIRVLEVGPDGEPTSLRVAFDDNLSSTQEMAGQKQTVPFAFSGKTVTITRAPGGNVTNDFQGQADPASSDELNNMLEGFRAIFPKEPVAVGDEWKADDQLLAKMMPLKGPNDRAGATMKLLGQKQVDGRDAAEVKVSTAVQGQQGEIKVEMIMQGTVLIDTATGHVVASDMKGSTTTRGTAADTAPDGTQVQYQVEGEGTIAIKGNSKIVGGGGGIVNDGPIAAPPVQVAGNGQSLAGKYFDDKLTIELADNNGQLAGTIIMGDTKFPMTARANGNGRITGQFDAGGDKFDFTANVNGNTMTLETGGTTYTLKKAGGRNPLAPGGGDAPKPKNPLGDAAPRNKAVDGPARNEAAAKPAPVALQTYTFPDGTGTVGLAEGWRTNAPSCANGFIVEGPADQKLIVGLSVPINTPNSTIIQMQRQTEMQARQMGMALPPRIPLLVAEFGDPVATFQTLLPQLNELNRMNKQPIVTIDKLDVIEKPQAALPGGHAAVIAYNLTKTFPDGRTAKYRSFARLETLPVGQDSFIFQASEAAAPEATFEKDLPAMIQMYASWKLDSQGLARVGQQNRQASQQQFEAGQRRHREMTASFDRHNQTWREGQKAQERQQATWNDGQKSQERQADDFIETMRETRTVEDTRTGERTDWNLGTVTDDVQKMNEAGNDPDRFKEIPLRDQ